MEPRFTRGEYFLLEIAVEHEWSISGLIDSELELHLNKKGHGLTRASLLESLYRLLSSGLIYAKNEVDGFILTYEQIECALNEPPMRVFSAGEKKHTSYGLTPEGGAQWEAFAAPDWEKYVEGGETFSDEDEDEYGIWELICADKEWLERYVESICFHQRLEVSLESVEWDYVAPWEVTYWKQLEGAHILRFQAQDKSEAEDYQGSPPASPEWHRGLWCVWR
ncbi:MAG: hypothetical protein OXH00_02510 [Candidatus Poribacteria bacterium]|nr:hypothetical protein [Candidatus Poribacteria bacterium]